MTNHSVGFPPPKKNPSKRCDRDLVGLKRVLIHFAALNLGLLMRVLVGVGTPRSLQGRLWALFSRLLILWRRLTNLYLSRWCASTTRQAILILTPAVICR